MIIPFPADTLFLAGSLCRDGLVSGGSDTAFYVGSRRVDVGLCGRNDCHRAKKQRANGSRRMKFAHRASPA